MKTVSTNNVCEVPKDGTNIEVAGFYDGIVWTDTYRYDVKQKQWCVYQLHDTSEWVPSFGIPIEGVQTNITYTWVTK